MLRETLENELPDCLLAFDIGLRHWREIRLGRHRKIAGVVMTADFGPRLSLHPMQFVVRQTVFRRRLPRYSLSLARDIRRNYGRKPAKKQAATTSLDSFTFPA